MGQPEIYRPDWSFGSLLRSSLRHPTHLNQFPDIGNIRFYHTTE